MNKKLVKVILAATMSFAVSAPAFANPFVDVPSTHWAYDAVQNLVKAGVVDGYNDKTFKGDKTITRYEMAQIVSKLMNKSTSLNGDQKVVVDKLAKEFSDELAAMDVKVNNVQDQLNKAVKISGDARVRYFTNDTATNKDLTDYRARITFDGKLNKDMAFSARLNSGNSDAYKDVNTVKLDTANVTFGLAGLQNTVGRQDIVLGNSFLADTQMNGITSKIGGLKLFAGNANQSTTVGTTAAASPTAAERIYGAEYATNLQGLKLTADYLKNTSGSVVDGVDYSIYGANASFNIAKGVALNGGYYKNDTTKDTAKAYGVSFTNFGLSATYRDVQPTALTDLSGLNTTTGNFYDTMHANGFKGMEYQYDKALAQNVGLSVKYQDFKDQNDVKLDARTSAVVNVKF